MLSLLFQIDSQMTVATVIWLMSERSHVQCHAKWGLVEYIPELNIERFAWFFIYKILNERRILHLLQFMKFSNEMSVCILTAHKNIKGILLLWRRHIQRGFTYIKNGSMNGAIFKRWDIGRMQKKKNHFQHHWMTRMGLVNLGRCMFRIC